MQTPTCVGCGKPLAGNVGNPPACDQACLQVAWRRREANQGDVVQLVTRGPRPAPVQATAWPQQAPLAAARPPLEASTPSPPEVVERPGRVGIAMSAVLILGLALARTGDIVTTLLAMDLGAAESNGLMSALLAEGFTGMIILNAALVLVVAIALVYEHLHPKAGKLPWGAYAAGYGLVVSIAVTIWNVIQTIGFVTSGHVALVP